MQRLQAVVPLYLIRSLFSEESGTRFLAILAGKFRSRKFDAEAMPEHLKQDLGLTDFHDRRHPPRRSPSGFDAARDVFLRRPL
jgi:hypothetical protein